ncbi:MAG: hypothetical protein ACMUJM_05305 [bacterium]
MEKLRLTPPHIGTVKGGASPVSRGVTYESTNAYNTEKTRE